jgi:beta-lactamase regulating signal transducer with metallopeptidase domain
MDLLPQYAWLEALGWALVNSWWQFGILWIVWMLVQKLWPLPSASSRYNLAMAFLLLGTVWAITTGIRSGLPAANTLQYQSTLSNTLTNSWWLALQGMISRFIPVFSVIYLLWLSVRFGQLAFQFRDLRRGTQAGIRKAPAAWRIFVETMTSRMELGKKVEIWLSEKIDSPQILGYLKPVILLPVTAFNQLSPDQAEAILIHELAHIKRNDYIWNWVVSILENLFFFNPFARLFISVIREEREHACDDWVLQFPFIPTEYAEALLLLEQKRSARSLPLVLAAGGSSRTLLLNRVKRMLQVPFQQTHKKIPASLFLLLVISAVAGSLLPGGKGFTNVENSLTGYEAGRRDAMLDGWSLPSSTWNALFSQKRPELSNKAQDSPIKQRIKIRKQSNLITYNSSVSIDNKAVNYNYQINDNIDQKDLSWVKEDADQELVVIPATAQIAETRTDYTFERTGSTTEVPTEAASFYMLPYVPKKSFETTPGMGIDTAGPVTARLKEEKKALEAALQTQLALNKVNWEALQHQIRELAMNSGTEQEIKSLLEKELAKINWNGVQQESARLLQQLSKEELLRNEAFRKEMAVSYEQAKQELERLDQELQKLQESLHKAMEIKKKQIQLKETELRKKHKIVHI